MKIIINCSSNVLKKIENDELKSVIIDFIKDKLESFSDADVYVDDFGDSEEGRAIMFR